MMQLTCLDSIIRVMGFTSLMILTFLWDSKVITTEKVGIEPDLFNNCIIERTFENRGLHRELKTRVALPMKSVPVADTDQMDVILVEHIPSGMYVDLFEIKSAADFGGPQVYSVEDIDIEKPKYMSPSHDILVFEKLQRTGTVLHTKISLPVHLRYQEPSPLTDFEEVTLPSPDLFIKAEITDPEDAINGDISKFICHPSSKHMCNWKKIPCLYKPTDGSLHFSVPVGKTTHKDIVVYLTLIVTIGATIFLGRSVVKKNTGKLKSS